MVLRQCLACNSTILGTLQICTCGHVFEDIPQTGGKRFSTYRATLYTRLEAKRLKCSEDENEELSDSDSADDVHEKQTLCKPKKSCPSLASRTKPRRSKGKRRRRTNAKAVQEDCHGNKTLSPFQSPEEESARFSRALQEINRRILGQSMIRDSNSTDGSCTCGHVFTEKRLIGGKRFSEYRAELYSRLEHKKQRLLIRESKPANDAIQDKDRFENPCSLKVDRQKSPNREKVIKRNSSSQRTKETFTRPKVIRRSISQPQIIKAKLDPTETKVLQSLLRRFPSALAEINKRLTSQNLLWFTLDARARHDHDIDQ